MKVVLLACLLLVACKHSSQPEWQDAIQKFNEAEKLQNENFKNLRFELSNQKVDTFATVKFVLRDQFGREWLFKYGRFQVDGAIAQWRLYHFLGLPTPEIHKITLNINGKPVPGTAQIFQKNIGTFYDFTFTELPKNALFDVGRNFIMGWASLNYHVHPKQFIVIGSESNKPVGIERIDNSVEWYLLGQDELRYDYSTPWYAPGGVGYRFYWRSYFRKDYDLNLTALHQFARAIESIPDDFFLSFFKPAKAGDFTNFSNVTFDLIQENAPDLAKAADSQNFLSRLVERKNHLGEDFEKFFKKMASIRGDQFNADHSDLSEFIKLRAQSFDREIFELKNESLRLQSQNIEKQKNFDMITCIPAHEILFDTYVFSDFDTREQRKNKLQIALDQLKKLYQESENENEKKAIRADIEQIEFSLDKKIYNISQYRYRLFGYNADKLMKLLFTRPKK